jgi:hypothetical protein
VKLGLYIAFAVLIAVAAALIWWGVRTCRTLWRHGTSQWGILVYNHGVKGFGVLTAVSYVLGAAYLGWSTIAATPDDRLACAIASALFAAAFGTPVALGMGYLWGTWMARYLGYEPDAR